MKTIEKLTFDMGRTDMELIDEDTHENIMDGEPHPNYPQFKEETNQWVFLAETNWGTDNGWGGLYLSKERSCVCAINSYDDCAYAWNVARDRDHIPELWAEYTRDLEEKTGFVDWLMERPYVIVQNLCDLEYGNDPYEGAPTAERD